ncbi:VOC family protein [Mucilaginibacter sp. UR6-11]|uniref:VOC family protein n=1 Tax=Mucilaginibacter sp. UR6-11 TaxID=1435644 RepID=UPI001E54FDCA|nr:VOC family protein [Mucilaginibacter sp. UR6-11]MCC8424775.1 VOC family protein [Mucilaginibacter sp. UR6-11]
MEPAINLNIKAIQHIGIPVTNVVMSALFYSRLGFANVMEKQFDHNGEQGICMMMKRDAMIIELYQLPNNALPEIAARKDGHIDHVAFDVADIDEAYSIIKEGGFNIIEPGPVFLQFWTDGCRYFNITGPDGERLEFNQVL